MTTRQATPDILGDILTENVSRETRGALMWIPVGRIYDNPYQPRLSYDDEQTRLLADNIWSLREELPATLGLQQPPVARVIRFVADQATALAREEYNDPEALRRRLLSNGHAVELHFGHRRLRAWRLLREREANAYAEFPVFLAHATDEAMWRHAVTENAQRKDISPLEEALTLQRAIEAFELTQEQAGAPFGYARATVANKLRLLGLPDEVRTLLGDGRLTERHGRELLRLAPAPHLLAAYQINIDKLTALSVRELEEDINRKIAACTPIAQNGRTGYRVWGSWDGEHLRNDTFDPPAWPLDWAPTEQVAYIVGPCVGCRFYAHFGGDGGARCSEALRTCFDAKQRRWQVEQAAAQQAALEASRRPAPIQTSPAPIQTSPTPIQDPQPSAREGKLLIDWTDEDWAAGAAEERQKIATLVPPADNRLLSDDAQAAPAPAPAPALTPPQAIAGVTIATDVRDADVQWFGTKGWNTAPAALLDKGLCSAERCKCLVLAYKQNPDPNDVRPDPEHAPNMCYGCTSQQRLANRKLELEHGDVQEMRKRVKAEQQEAERLLSEARGRYGQELWQSRTFAMGLIRGNVHRAYAADKWDLATMQEQLFMAAAAYACKRWENNKEVWVLERVQEWLQKLASEAGRTAPAGPIVAAPSQAGTNATSPGKPRQPQWTAEDEATYQSLVLDCSASPKVLMDRVEEMYFQDMARLTPAVLRQLADAVADRDAKYYFNTLAEEIVLQEEHNNA